MRKWAPNCGHGDSSGLFLTSAGVRVAKKTTQAKNIANFNLELIKDRQNSISSVLNASETIDVPDSMEFETL